MFTVTISRDGTAPRPVAGCYDWPTNPALRAGQFLQASGARSLTLPSGTDITYGDAVTYPDGRLWHVTDQPEDWTNPHAQHRPGVQATVERILVDACDVERKTGTSTDPANGMKTPMWTTLHSNVACGVRIGETQPGTHDAADQRITVLRDVVYLPLSIIDVRVDDRIVIKTTRDPALVGVPLYVRGIPRGSGMALRTLAVSEVQS